MTKPERARPSVGDSRRRVLVFLRFLTLLVIANLLMFNRLASPAFKNQAVLLIAVFLVSILVMFFFAKTWFEKKVILFVVFLLDTVFVVYGLYLSGTKDTDLFIVYFLTIFIAAIVGDLKGSIGVAVSACFLYVLLQYRETGHWVNLETRTLMKLPFLFIVATFSGFLAAEARSREEQAEHDHDLRDSLAQQADTATRKLMESNRSLDAVVEYHRRILASIQTGVIVAHRDGKVRTFNEAAARITGYEESRVAGLALTELPDNLRPLTALLERTLKDGTELSQENLEFRSARSENVSVSVQTAVLRGGDGAVLGAIATLKDMSLMRQMELQLMRSERLSALGEMAAGVAHEIKNPLNAIQGFSQRLSSKLEDPNLKKYADIIVDEVRRMDTIINDVLEYNRTQKPVKKPADMHLVLESAFVFLTSKLEQTGVQLVKEFAPGLPTVPMDPDKMKQVLLNLMINAVHAMEKGGTLTIRTRLEEGMTLAADDQANPDIALLQQVFLQQKMVSVSIVDTGCGIPKENIAKLFHPFFTTKTVGTGLGLSICHKIVESHGGFIRIESELGKGSAFTVYLPVED